jgi:protein-S-isoprenylcysteine O-methyltransferase Ste14
MGILIFELPVPLYWLVLHGPVEFWRRHGRWGYFAALVVAWGFGGWLMYRFRADLFLPPERIAVWTMTPGAILIALDIYLLSRVEMTLGGRRLIGTAELRGGGELATNGLYKWVRHPRYLGMIAAVLGGSLLVGTAALWAAVALWLVLALAMIRVEELELRRRFGAAYEAYASRVPALLPFRI